MYKIILKGCKWIGSSILLIFILYLLMVIILGTISLNSRFESNNGEVSIYVVSNGTHTSIAFPTLSPLFDWQEIFPVMNTKKPHQSAYQPYTLIGWGSRVFYTEVGTWREITFKKIIQAIFLDDSAYYIAYIDRPIEDSYAKRINISKKQYQQLINAILQDLLLDDSRKASVIPNYHYMDTDAFYEAKGHYSPFYTCNNWTHWKLRSIGVKTPIWSPFSQPIMWHLK